jgi:hypothetical protein
MSALSDALKDVLVRFGVIKSEAPLEEEQISYEIVYEPEVKDGHGQWMTADTIRKGCENFNENLAAGIVQPNLYHLADTDKFTIEKSWINEELDVVVSGSEEPISAGSWVVKVKYNDKNLWSLKKAGVVQGVSIGCMGNINEETGEITDLTFDGE